MAASAQGPAAGPTPSALAEAIQRRYDTVRDLRADFVHAYQGGVLRKTAVERGTVTFKKPGMMRWEYTSPERKTFIADGVRLYAYVPEDRQVTVSAVPSGEELSTPALFLAGRGHLTRDFVASPVEPESLRLPGMVGVTLKPRKSEAEFEWMILLVDPATFQIRGLETVDAQGGRSAFTFGQIRENSGVPDTHFRFTIPRGVDVITNSRDTR